MSGREGGREGVLFVKELQAMGATLGRREHTVAFAAGGWEGGWEGG